jgi:hypothetical protein
MEIQEKNIFTFEDEDHKFFGPLRAFTDEVGAAWFYAEDVIGLCRLNVVAMAFNDSKFGRLRARIRLQALVSGCLGRWSGFSRIDLWSWSNSVGA